MIRINDIIDKILDYQPDSNIDLVERAYVFSAKVHDGQMRLSGEPYLSHPMEVAGMLADLKLDVESIAAGLLHDVIEDTHATDEEITKIFGEGVCNIVKGVTKLTELDAYSTEVRKAENLRKMILAMADDIRVIMVKLVDRLHNMRTLKYHRKESKKVAISQETYDIYVPIASRLGLYKIKKELEDISFMYLQPEDYQDIQILVDKDSDEREKFIETVKKSILEKVEKAGLKCKVVGRYKHFKSIHDKMIEQSLEFEDVYDIIAFRIILETEAQCYEVLGLVHSLWNPIPKKFKDYIGCPKPNMYQSLHTTVIGPSGERVEIQIRTQKMDRVAKSGIAAHWAYKENGHYSEKTGSSFAWIQNIVENQLNRANPGEFLENVKIDLFPDEVRVFTPTGEIKTLPKGATPVDFAYIIHTEVGNQCTGAKVNGRMVTLKTELKNGDTVEVITTKGHTPSKDWLGFVKTVKARSKIRSWVKSLENERSLTLGRELCEKAFRKSSINFNTFLKNSEEVERAIASFGLKTLDELIINVGYGKVTPRQLIGRIAPKTRPKRTSSRLISKLIGRKKKKPNEAILVKGLDDILIRFGKCCQPVPGDEIVGYITQGHGVTIHRKNCKHSLEINPDRHIDVSWNLNIEENMYPVKIVVKSVDKVGLFAEITSRISKIGTNILNANMEVSEMNTVDSYFTLSVESIEQLSNIFSSIKKIKNVKSVKRID
ncbi:MAG: bifunctional (p)ppGpp synthetase/guanosine-3',5'-bis(diphosphate) 3'-pyrophosphohydrolase [Proteobacteria bacterium]|nr:bifunctional (p)ppGpp synthetase/guanosine-3',5'-bis(diphosphate) 3'-pyrophosphohydrolase [Pseudomonadota bacterium]